MTNEQISDRIKTLEGELARLRGDLTEKKYPYFGRDKGGTVVLLTGTGKGDGKGTGIVVIASGTRYNYDRVGHSCDTWLEYLLTPCEIQVKL